MSKYGSVDPHANVELSNRFEITIDGIGLMAFETCTIPESSWTVINNRTGIDGDTFDTSSGNLAPQVITFGKHFRVGGKDELMKIMEWHRQGSKEKKDGAIAMFDRDGVLVMSWKWERGWISKRSNIDLNALSEGEPVPFVFEISVAEIVPE